MVGTPCINSWRSRSNYLFVSPGNLCNFLGAKKNWIEIISIVRYFLKGGFYQNINFLPPFFWLHIFLDHFLLKIWSGMKKCKKLCLVCSKLTVREASLERIFLFTKRPKRTSSGVRWPDGIGERRWITLSATLVLLWEYISFDTRYLLCRQLHEDLLVPPRLVLFKWSLIYTNVAT